MRPNARKKNEINILSQNIKEKEFVSASATWRERE
jgi:hypothetical protein